MTDTVAPGRSDAPPVELSLESPLEVERWRPLVHWLLAIPQLVMAAVLMWIAGLLGVVAFVFVLFTRRVPEGIHNWIVMAFRYQWRTATYAAFLREVYPAFDFDPVAVDPGVEQAQLTVRPADELNRWLPLVKWILIIPHLLVLAALMLGVYFGLLIGFFAVLFTGQWPIGVRLYIVNVARWAYRVSAYMYFLRDEYPPFALGRDVA